MNTISYKELKDWYLNDEDAKANAKKYFGNKQPSIYETGFYSAPSWNWGYRLGLVGVNGTGSDHDGNGIQSGTTKVFEVVTQFGEVKAARLINIPILTDDKV
jgi:hypothetical protein